MLRLMAETLYSLGTSAAQEVRDRDQYDADADQQRNIGHEVREYHQRKPAHQRHHRPLPPAVNEEPQPDRAEQQSP